jgi:hypothetical protein
MHGQQKITLKIFVIGDLFQIWREVLLERMAVKKLVQLCKIEGVVTVRMYDVPEMKVLNDKNSEYCRWCRRKVILVNSPSIAH